MYQNDKTFFFESRFFFAGKCKKLEKPCNNLLRTNYEGFVYLRVAFFSSLPKLSLRESYLIVISRLPPPHPSHR